MAQAKQEAVIINYAALESLRPDPVPAPWTPQNLDELAPPTYGGGHEAAVQPIALPPQPQPALPAVSQTQSEGSYTAGLRLAGNGQSSSPQSPEDNRLGISAALYVGQLTDGHFSGLFYKPWDTGFKNTNLVALSAAYEIYRFPFGLGVELEAGVGRRFSKENLWEFWTAAAIRWHEFPWNDVVKTTAGLAFFGPNYVTEISPHEVDRNGGKRTHWMNFFAPEITLAHPDLPQAALLIRLHHRSGLAGLYNGTTSGSTFLSVGTRYFF